MSDAQGAQHLGAAALGESQVVGVIDDAAGVGVLVIDADGKPMDRAVQMPARIIPPRSLIVASASGTSRSSWAPASAGR